MKKFLPFVFPFIALVIVLFLAIRWYNSKTVHTSDKIANFGDNVKIEQITQSDQQKIKQPAADVKSVQMQVQSNDVKGTSGQIRYEISNGKVSFTVNAELPELKQGLYQVWLQEVNGNTRKKAFTLTFAKGGYEGSAAIGVDVLPVDVVVSQENRNDDNIETVLMKGSLAVQNAQ